MFNKDGETQVILAFILAVSVECANPDTDRGQRELDLKAYLIV